MATKTKRRRTKEEASGDTAAEASAPVAADPAPAPKAAPAPVAPVAAPDLPYVTLQVFSQLCTVRPDDLAGFVFWAGKCLPARCTMEQWNAHWEAFLHRPV